MAGCFYTFAFYYGYYILKEVKPKQKTIENTEKTEKSEDIKPGVMAFLEDFFDRKHVYETFRVAFKSGVNQRRLRIIMLMVVVVVIIGPQHGRLPIELYDQFD